LLFAFQLTAPILEEITLSILSILPAILNSLWTHYS